MHLIAGWRFRIGERKMFLSKFDIAGTHGDFRGRERERERFRTP